jgi:hypothetical protein
VDFRVPLGPEQPLLARGLEEDLVLAEGLAFTQSTWRRRAPEPPFEIYENPGVPCSRMCTGKVTRGFPALGVPRRP